MIFFFFLHSGVNRFFFRHLTKNLIDFGTGESGMLKMLTHFQDSGLLPVALCCGCMEPKSVLSLFIYFLFLNSY